MNFYACLKNIQVYNIKNEDLQKLILEFSYLDICNILITGPLKIRCISRSRDSRP